MFKPPHKLSRYRRLLRLGPARVKQLVQVLSTPRPTGVAQLRCGIVGLGSMGRTHADVLRSHPYFSVAAISSQKSEKRSIAKEYDCRWFDTATALIASNSVDLIVIATPHWHHADVAIEALRAGLHVVCEKPLAVTVKQADQMLKTAQESNRLLTAVFQTRFEPAYQRAKTLLASGELGRIIRCEMLETFWRSNAYYRSQPWRATWKGEGGGVLLNQAPHVLDRYLWLCGMPKSVTGFCDTFLHNIEVEDMASAVVRHEDGHHGILHINTTECPWLSRTMIACDRGRITIQNGGMEVERLVDSIQKRTATSSSLFDNIEGRREDVRERFVESTPELLAYMYENVALAIAGRQPLLVTAGEAANAVELANAILLSSAYGHSLDLPIDRAAYEKFILSKSGRTGASSLMASV